MIITHKSQVSSYKPRICFDQKLITNLMELKTLINHYCVTYNSLYEIFIVHQEEYLKHNM